MNESTLALLLDILGVCFLILSLIAAAKEVMKKEVKHQVAKTVSEISAKGEASSLITANPNAAGEKASEGTAEKNILELILEFIKTAPTWLLLGAFGLFLIFADKWIANLILGT
jgi:hypothetical protein